MNRLTIALTALLLCGTAFAVDVVLGPASGLTWTGSGTTRVATWAPASTPQADAYFGNCDSNGAPLAGYGVTFWGSGTWYNAESVVPFTCPGTGARTLASMGILAQTRGAPHSNVRMALYENDLDEHYDPVVRLVCQWASPVLVNSTQQWWSSSSFTGTNIIYGGSKYILAFSESGSLVSIGYTSLANATRFLAPDYTSGFPDPIAAGAGNSLRPSVRAFVTGGDGTGTHPPAPTMEIYYVDPSYTGAVSSGVTSEPYKSLAAAVSNECNKTLVRPIQIRCRTSGGVPDTNCVAQDLNQCVTSVSNYIDIVAETGHLAGTTWDTNKYHLTPNWTRQAGTAINWAKGFTRFRGLQIGIATQTNMAEIVYWSQGSNSWMDGCSIKGLNNGDFMTRGISSIDGINVFNTIIYNLGTNIVGSGVKNHGPSRFQNCTILSGGIGIDITDGSVSTSKNCYVSSSGAAAYSVGGAGASLTMTTCASDDNTGSAGLTNIIANATTFSNVTAGAEDWRLVTGSPLVNVGTDTSGDAAPFNFTNGIRGNVRSGSWDIGADEL